MKDTVSRHWARPDIVRLRTVDEQAAGGQGRTVGLIDQLEPGVASFLSMECRLHRLVCLAVSQVAGLLVGVNVPNNVVGQANDLVAGTLGHLGEALGFGLVLESVRGEVDACGNN